jgi:Secretion system C-terminal sorting domain
VGTALIYSGADGNRIWVVKINQFGDTLWTRVLGGPNTGALSVASSSDGGCVITGECNFSCVIKLDQNGNIVWDRNYGGDGIQCWDIIKTSDGGYIVCGRINLMDGYVLKIDSLGILQWQRTYATPSVFKDFESIIEIKGEGYTVCGSVDSINSPNIYGYIMKVDNLGYFIWDNIFKINNLSANTRSINISNNNYIVGGNYNGSPYPYYFAIFDMDGKFITNKNFRSTRDEYFDDMKILNENRYIMTTERDSISLYSKIIITDSSGNIINQKEYYAIDDNSFKSILPLDNGDLVFLGSYKYTGVFNTDFYAMRTDSNLNSTPLGINANNLTLPKDFQLLNNYPNPFNNSTTIQYELKQRQNIKLMLYDIGGKYIATLLEEQKNPGYYKYYLNTESYGLSSGIYFVKLISNNGYNVNQKILLIK